MQMGFMPAKETIDAIFILRQMLKKRKWKKEICIDLEKALIMSEER